MPTDKVLNDLVINKIPTQEIYKALKEQGKINEDDINIIENTGCSSVSMTIPAYSDTDTNWSKSNGIDLKYDLNGDGIVDESDVSQLFSIYNTDAMTEDLIATFDFTNDGKVTVSDVDAFSRTVSNAEMVYSYHIELGDITSATKVNITITSGNPFGYKQTIVSDGYIDVCFTEVPTEDVNGVIMVIPNGNGENVWAIDLSTTQTYFALKSQVSELTPENYFTFTKINSYVSLTGLTDEGKSLSKITIPDKLDGLKVLEFGMKPFQNCTNLVDMILPHSVFLLDTYIGSSMFDGCTSLRTIVIPNNVTSIDSNAFNGCTSLATVYYTGTEEQWNAITIDDGNDPLINATKVFNYGTPIQKLPVVSSADAGKTMSVSETGEWELVTMEFITIEDIDTICGSEIVSANDTVF